MKENIFNRIEEKLKTNEKYIAEDGKLLRTVVYTDIMTMDQELIALLLSDELIKERFFTDVDGTLVFDKLKLAWLVDSKEFLPDSFTKYANKIGLTTKGEFISANDDVVLDFPYKDGVLEGGQTKDDQKRKEIIYHELIAQDEITSMLRPKVFTNAKRYTKEGVEEDITELREDDNLIIKGNNLVVLSSLLKRYEGKVKLIYIDPPYNTKNDSFNYNDNFNHSTWLVFMKNRLELAKRLLRDDGVILIQTDNNENHYIKVLMDEIFGRGNFITQLVLEMSLTQGMKVNSAQKGNIVKNVEYILMYNKNGEKDVLQKLLYEAVEGYDNHYTKYVVYDDEKEEYHETPLIEVVKSNFEISELFNKYGFDININSFDSMINISEEFNEWIIKHSSNIYRTMMININIPDNIKRQLDEENIVEYNGYLLTKTSTGTIEQLNSLENSFGWSHDYNPKYGRRRIRGDLWKGYFSDMMNVGKEGKVELKNGKKPERLIKDIIYSMTQPGDLVIDYHLGSGTTAAVAHKMGRRYIGVEQMDYIEDIAVERMGKVIAGEQGGISKAVEWEGGGSFVYCELKEDGVELIRDIQNADESNIDGMKEMVYTDDRLVPYLRTSDLRKVDEDFEELDLDNKKKVLMKLVNKNFFYVDYLEMEDMNYNVSDVDKKFTRSFYDGT